ncbi:MAG: amidohydrolase family protein [Myxococcales bacterium]|nr:amidohydrolase family protein [Myxococcales bacterium]
MIIDCHCHAGKGDGLTGPWDTSAPLQSYLHRAASAGIARTVVFSAFHSNNRVANMQVAMIVSNIPDRLWGFVFVHPIRDAGRVYPMVRRFVDVYGFCGIKVHRHDGRITREICDTAQLLKLPVLYDVVGETAPLALIAAEYPTVSWIIPHLGSFADDWAAQSQLIDLLVRFDNLYADTAGVRRFDLLAEAIERAGPHKILFGSDGPWLHPGLELAKIRALRLAPQHEALVMGGNLLRLVQPGLVRRQRHCLSTIRSFQSTMPFNS